MPQICRIGDTNEMRGAIVSGARTVFANGILVGQQGSKISPHAPWNRKSHPPHNSATITNGSPTVFADGIAVARVGSGNSCGHHMAQGSPDVFVP
jgi:uncharacterized Zn-binding protein involved in type VI secretion